MKIIRFKAKVLKEALDSESTDALHKYIDEHVAGDPENYKWFTNRREFKENIQRIYKELKVKQPELAWDDVYFDSFYYTFNIQKNIRLASNLIFVPNCPTEIIQKCVESSESIPILNKIGENIEVFKDKPDSFFQYLLTKTNYIKTTNPSIAENMIPIWNSIKDPNMALQLMKEMSKSSLSTLLTNQMQIQIRTLNPEEVQYVLSLNDDQLTYRMLSRGSVPEEQMTDILKKSNLTASELNGIINSTGRKFIEPVIEVMKARKDLIPKTMANVVEVVVRYGNGTDLQKFLSDLIDMISDGKILAAFNISGNGDIFDSENNKKFLDKAAQYIDQITDYSQEKYTANLLRQVFEATADGKKAYNEQSVQKLLQFGEKIGDKKLVSTIEDEVLQTSSDDRLQKNTHVQSIKNASRQDIEALKKRMDEFVASKGNKDVYSWSEFGKAMSVNSAPGSIKKALMSLNKNGKVAKDDIEKFEQQFASKEYGVSHNTYNSAQTLRNQPTKVIQLNLTKELLEEMRADPVFYEFFTNVSAASFRSSHPTIKNLTIAWMRYETSMESIGVWLIEEVQSDFFSVVKQQDVLQDVFDGDEGKMKEFVQKASQLFEHWERALIAHLKNEAMIHRIQHVFMVSDLIKMRTADLQGGTKLTQIYQKLPQAVGFHKITHGNFKQELQDLKIPSKTIADIEADIFDYLQKGEYIWYAPTNQIRERKEKKGYSLMEAFKDIGF